MRGIALIAALLVWSCSPSEAHRYYHRGNPVMQGIGIGLMYMVRHQHDRQDWSYSGPGSMPTYGDYYTPQARQPRVAKPRRYVHSTKTRTDDLRQIERPVATNSGGGLVHAKLADGQIIVVAAQYAARFIGFFNALFQREGRLPEITCLASGHMRHSLHHWGGACDVGQTARNVAWRPMYHVGSLARMWGLTDGCDWSYPDCGHVDVSGVGGGGHYARRTHIRYAGR